MPAKVVVLAVLLGTAAIAVQQNAPAITLRETARIGCALCGGAEELGVIQAVSISAQGVLVIDQSAPQLRFFDRSGKLVKSVGSKGSGPGEYGLPIGVAWFADNQIDVVDMRPLRITRLGADRAALQTRRLTSFPMAVGGNLTGGELLLVTTDFVTPGFAIEAWPRNEAAPHALMRLDTLFPRGHDGGPAVVFPFAARPGGGFAVSDAGARYRIRLYDSTGRQQKEIARTLERPRKTTSEIDRETARLARAGVRMARMRAAEGGSPGSPQAPKPFPFRNHIRGLDFDAAGRLWVLTGRAGDDLTIFDVFDSQGQLIREVRLPEAIERFDAGADLMVTSGEHPDGFPVVKLWRMPLLP